MDDTEHVCSIWWQKQVGRCWKSQAQRLLSRSYHQSPSCWWAGSGLFNDIIRGHSYRKVWATGAASLGRSVRLYLWVNVLLPHRTGLVPKVLPKWWKIWVMLTQPRKGLNPQWGCRVCLSSCPCRFLPDLPGSSHRTKDIWVTGLLKDCKRYRSPSSVRWGPTY